MKRKNQMRIIVYFVPILMILYGCSSERPVETESEDEPVVLEEGSTADEPEYFVDEDGKVIYRDSRTSLEGEDSEEAESETELSEDERLFNEIPVFPGAQRIFPSGENQELRKSYITRASIDAVSRFYNNFLAYGEADVDTAEAEPENLVNTITSVEDDRHQATLFVNPDEGSRGGMKVLLKEFPAQQAVQIVHTTLSATPAGLDPVGIYVSPEEVEEWIEQTEEENEEMERQRTEAEAEAIDPHESDDDEDGDSEESGEED